MAFWNRRDLLCAGGLGALGLSLPGLLSRAQANVAAPRAKNCILVFLLGGPPQHETWDPKPQAPAEIRGDFRPIATNVPGIHVGELMPRTAGHLDKICVLRAVASGTSSHSGSGYEMLTGMPHPNKQAENLPMSGGDWPSMGAVVTRLSRGRPGLPAAVTLPQRIYNTGFLYWPGQDAGFLGRPFDPWLLDCMPQADDFRIRELSLPTGVPLLRFNERQELQAQFDAQSRHLGQQAAYGDYDRHFSQALDLIATPRARQAFDLTQEPAALRDRYGRHRFSQSCLLARRLVEAGVRLVQVNWPREPSEDNASNPAWDTHNANTERLRTALMPPMDQAYSALLEDLDQRGLLDETLVVWMGEFGRTPRINANGGRDHWGNCYSVALAGGGVRGGQVHGVSDALGAMPRAGRVTPQDLVATIFATLGFSPDLSIVDTQGRPHPISRGEVIHAIL